MRTIICDKKNVAGVAHDFGGRFNFWVSGVWESVLRIVDVSHDCRVCLVVFHGRWVLLVVRSDGQAGKVRIRRKLCSVKERAVMRQGEAAESETA